MLEVPIYNPEGRKTGAMSIDEKDLGGTVNLSLLKQAIVTYHANQRSGTAATKSRGMVDGSTRKLYRQKGTGNARRGAIRTNIMRGGGRAFAKTPRDMGKKLPQNMRKAALRSAVLAKILGQDLMILEGLSLESPKTKQMVAMMKNLKINRSCLLALGEANRSIYLSSRNIQDLTVRVAGQMNAFDVATRQKMLITPDAMKALVSREAK